jgi:hypothetical protein
MTCERTSLVAGVLTLASLGLILNSSMQGSQDDPAGACATWKNSLEKTSTLVEEFKFKQWNPLYEMAEVNRKSIHEMPLTAPSSFYKAKKEMSKVITDKAKTREREMELAKLRYTIHWQCNNPPFPSCSKPYPCLKR